jgi:hypothetical protein
MPKKLPEMSIVADSTATVAKSLAAANRVMTNKGTSVHRAAPAVVAVATASAQSAMTENAAAQRRVTSKRFFAEESTTPLIGRGH